jgi:dihydrofolate synthase/folylpolyglutamate synthase
VQINGQPVEREVLGGAIARVVEHVREDTHTWFEAFTAAAFLCFAEAGLDASVVEVGLGGRLDSTNVVGARAACITGIELEHTQVLGDTIAAIAGEKAGILRPGVPCVTGASGEALAVIEAAAARLGSPLVVLGSDFDLRVGPGEAGGRRITIAGQTLPGLSGRAPVRARFQARALALAWATFVSALPDRAVRRPPLPLDWVRAALPPGRFQVLRDDPPLVVDGAHTDGSLQALGEELAEAFPGQRFDLVFAVAADKRWRAGLGRLLALADRVVVAPLRGKPGEAPETIAEFCRTAGVPCALAASVEAAVAAADPGRGLLVTGSLYAAGDALRVLGTQPGR